MQRRYLHLTLNTMSIEAIVACMFMVPASTI